MQKVTFCPNCGLRHYVFTSDKTGTLVRCIECGKTFTIDLNNVISEFDYDKYPENGHKESRL